MMIAWLIINDCIIYSGSIHFVSLASTLLVQWRRKIFSNGGAPGVVDHTLSFHYLINNNYNNF